MPAPYLTQHFEMASPYMPYHEMVSPAEHYEMTSPYIPTHDIPSPYMPHHQEETPFEFEFH
jgi:hypothetical protein